MDEDYITDLKYTQALPSDDEEDFEEIAPNSSNTAVLSVPSDNLIAAAYTPRDLSTTLIRNRLKSHVIWKSEKAYKKIWNKWWKSISWGLKIERGGPGNPL